MQTTKEIVARILRGQAGYHLLALLTIAVWGTTFISTKVLLRSGLSPADIMLCRFALAYVCICLCSRPLRWRADSWRDEGLCLLSGLTGASLYFITENTALQHTLVANVSLIVCACPLLTLLGQCLLAERRWPGRWLCLGTLLALLGVAVVILRGQFVLRLNPLGDFLCLGTALSWTAYTFINRRLLRRYPSLFVVRKTFVYGLLTLAPFILLQGGAFRAGLGVLLQWSVLGQLLFLGLVASFLCFMWWNVCLRHVDTVLLNNYIYLGPIVSILTAHIVLGEGIGPAVVLGTALVIVGMVMAGQKRSAGGPKRANTCTGSNRAAEHHLSK